jgi:transcriptional regulator with XRE-family HTH domain
MGRLAPSLDRALASIRRKLHAARAGSGSWNDTRKIVLLLDECVHDLNVAAGLPDELDVPVRSAVVQGALPAWEYCRQGDPEAAADWLAQSWETQAQLQIPPERLALYSVTVSDLLNSRSREDRARQALRRLMTYLGLSQDQVGRMFRVSGETIRRWESGQTRIPVDREAELAQTDAALSRLLAIFQPDKLAQVVRRPAGLLDGRRALDWILEGRIGEVAGRYEMSLAYQA